MGGFLFSLVKVKLEAVTHACDPGANINITDAALLVGNVQSNVFNWVELHTCAVGETVVAGVCISCASSLEFTVTNTDYTVDACPIVDAVSWTSSDAVVL